MKSGTSRRERTPDSALDVDLLRAGLQCGSPTVRWSSAIALGESCDDRVVPWLLAAASDRSGEVRMRVAEALGALLADRRKAPRALVRLTKDRQWLVRVSALEALRAIGDNSTCGTYWLALNDPQPLVRRTAASAIGCCGSTRDVSRLTRSFEEERSDAARVGFLEALVRLGEGSFFEMLLEMLASRQYQVRISTSHVLATLRLSPAQRQRARTALREVLKAETGVATREAIQFAHASLSR